MIKLNMIESLFIVVTNSMRGRSVVEVMQGVATEWEIQHINKEIITLTL
jgi:hypothetical protein